MIWLILALILAIPAWLGLTRPRDSAPRRLIGRFLLYGLVLGWLVSLARWLIAPQARTGADLIQGPLWGAAAGGAVGLLIGLPWMLVVRRRRARGAALQADNR